MSSGRSMQNNAKGTPLNSYISSPENQQVANANSNTLSIKESYIHRFGNDTPNSKLPTQ